MVSLGRTFPVKDRSGAIVEGITNGSFGLTKVWDAEAKKEVTTSDVAAIYFSTHKLKEPKALGESGLKKVGWVTAKIAVAADAKAGVSDNVQEPATEAPQDDEEIPF
jgi:hypothetical protein